MKDIAQGQFAEYFGENDAATGLEITKTFVALLAGNWLLIRKVAEDPEAGGKVKVGLSLNLNFTGKTACGSINLSYAIRRTDEAEFHVEDADQQKLPLDRATVAVQFGPGASADGPLKISTKRGAK